jgi:hypothetical protein
LISKEGDVAMRDARKGITLMGSRDVDAEASPTTRWADEGRDVALVSCRWATVWTDEERGAL